MQENILNKFSDIATQIDLLIFSDFSYGCLPRQLVSKIIEIAKK